MTRSDLLNLADLLDPERASVAVDEIDQDLSQRSSSTWAKNALASLRMSLAQRSSLMSHSNALIHSSSSVHRQIELISHFGLKIRVAEPMMVIKPVWNPP